MSGVQVACILLVASHVTCLPLNNRPIIGVVDQCTGLDQPYGDTYISATYVKFLEQAGARVVPVRVKQPKEYYETLLSRINGVLFPGGDRNLTSSYLATAARIIYDIVVELSVLVVAISAGHVTYNNRPVIGVLAQATASKTHGDTYIPANYVKYLEQAGARVVPIRVREPGSYYAKLFSQINGVLFPGGSVGIVSSDYAKAARIIYDMAVKANDAGDHFPLWGTCQGFQLLTNLTARHNLLQAVDASDISLPLDLAPDAKSSRLLSRLSQKTFHILTTENVTPNFHHYGLLLETYNQTKSLTSFYRLISTNRGRKGKVFVSTIEAYKYPFYGTQWHPEKINFDWNPKHALDHTSNGVAISHFFSAFFIGEARLSGHKFPNVQAAADAVIENFNMNYQDDGTFEQIYYFNYTKPSA